MVKCGICFEDYQESDVELHREMCVVRLMFRCSLCYEDYVSKEGLWNHLDLHEILDDSKEMYSEEIKAKHKLHQCVICNDHRAYSENPYWKHVQEVHDGSFLRCSDSGENFHSEKLKNDHASSSRSSRCITNGQIETLEFKILKEEPDPIEVENGASDAEGGFKSANQDQNQILVPSSDSPSSSNVAEVPDLSTVKKDLADKSVQPLVEDQSLRSAGISSGIQCVHCGKECLSTYKLREHISHLHKPFKCKICGITFKGSSRLRYHRVMTHDKPKFQCDKCQKIFPSLKPYKRHTNNCDPVQSDFSINKKSGDILLKEQSASNPVAENPSCEVCSQFGIKESCAYTLARHTLMHHDPVACNFCGINLSSLVEAQLHVKQNHQESKHKCPHCSAQFHTARRLDRHVILCKDNKVPCELCGKMLKDEIAVQIHQIRGYCVYQKNKEQQFFESSLPQTKCLYCSEEFPSLGLMNRHLKICHELTKCDICGITVLGLSVYNKHKNIQHKEPKHECSKCGQKFHDITKYNMHRFACEDKKYLCQLCGRMFQKLQTARMHTKRDHPEENSFNNIEIVQLEKQDQNNDLKMEITIEETTISAHDDLQQSKDGLCSKTDASSESSSSAFAENAPNQQNSCKICGITFANYFKATYHRRTRHKEPTHQCPYCPKKFHFRKILERHVSACVAFKHSCELCGQKFAFKDSLENHKRRDHQDRLPEKLDDAQFSEVLDTEDTEQPNPSVNRQRKETESSENLKMVALEGEQREQNEMDAEVDAFQTFGNFIPSKLRQIPDVAVANRVQRNLTRNLMDLIDKAEADQLL